MKKRIVCQNFSQGNNFMTLAPSQTCHFESQNIERSIDDQIFLKEVNVTQSYIIINTMNEQRKALLPSFYYYDVHY